MEAAQGHSRICQSQTDPYNTRHHPESMNEYPAAQTLHPPTFGMRLKKNQNKNSTTYELMTCAHIDFTRRILD